MIDLQAIIDRVGAVEPLAGRTRVLAIDGRAGVGKTTLAAELGSRLAGSTVLAMDSVYPGWGGLAEGSERLVSDVLKPLADGSPAGIRSWDWQHDRELEWQPLEIGELLIVEGVGSASQKAAPFLSCVVWLEAEPALRRERALNRDGQMFATHWDAWASQEDQLFARERPAERADFRYDTGSNG
ncbi:MAG: hypothetical protein NT122_01555 [Solirubrobacterales bacterium]|nr:hypothetical protein [Solirubrobacterales bacterium]